ncbi:sensor histidine kinase [uncultured Robinsoniella sp.]|uniref:sensor histidine kinase n=1 Tax=uncultured Robinsoniella sp. TaxID=904190 RepID=UPI00374FBC9E
MDKIREYKIIGRYMKDHLMEMVAVVIFTCIFILIFYLYGIPVKIYGYAFLLCVAVGVVMITISYWKYRSRHMALVGLFSRITVECSDLPPAGNLPEADYQEILLKLFYDTAQNKEQEERSKKDMMDYYTLWAHQIKTPITAMRLLIQVEDNARNQSLLQQLLKIERYVDMVLQYLRMEDMSSDLKLQEYKVLDLVRKAVKQDSSVFIYRKIPFELTEMDDTVITDEKWMVFVIEQILSNALKYTNEGKISVYMDPNERQTLIIEDTGIGIQEEDLPRIFENGFTGYNGRMGKKSTGIGLYLCKKILDRLGHSIKVSSKVGHGTRIAINLYREQLKTE